MAISLQKGQKISLRKEYTSDDNQLNMIIMGLGWSSSQKKSLFDLFKKSQDDEGVDLDASCFVFDSHKKLSEVIFFNKLRGQNGAIIHSGDNRTGDSGGDDEQIIVTLNQLSPNIETLIFTVSNYTGQNFNRIQEAYCRLIDAKNNNEIARYDLVAQGNHTAQIMAKIYRSEGEWKMQAIGDNTKGVTPQDLIEKLRPYL